MELEETKVTVVITPRDRYSGIVECIENLYRVTKQPFKLIVLDLAYPKHLKKQINALLEDKDNAEIVNYGLIIPMEAMRRIRPKIDTPYVMFLDNDSNVTENWLPPLLSVAEQERAAIVNPLTLEKEGVDEGASLRNHLYTNEIRIVNVEGSDYLIEDKHFRRALPQEIPQEIAPSEMFELHGVLFETQFLHDIELPQMVIREHIDIGIQAKKMGRKILTQPESVVIFDNLGTRMQYFDMKFFFFRWNPKLTWKSSRLFEERWGYNFYAEQAMYHWVFRRKIFLFCRWLHLPISLANTITRVLAKIKTSIKPVWDPLKNPVAQSKNFFEVSGQL
ncbi:glycosyltransferase [Thalassotalea agarivorans]|uniref:Glycosyltransferase, GT2 family n=1 Tax=Thalassotalea agarivorans TaxID=349064 RepID=A0A1I0DVG8_THASX|nr:glycosyltransferase [Thalassotalea agarivorans]SET36649.1 Glycosyltransferase, GT2 family [Thalassotalea agarivorans]